MLQDWFLISALLILIFLIDDLFIDIYSLIKGLKPVPKVFATPPQSPIAIMVANWQEEDVLEAMIQTNYSQIQDDQVHYFLGVYPNDLKTREIAVQLAKDYENVHAVINRQEGPTYKGQMLDEVIEGILSQEKDLGLHFVGFVFHDSEDVIDPESIDVYRHGLIDHDFIQIPVLSLPLENSHLVGATYMDEFAEAHSKDMLVRKSLGVAIPSAGVGTCLSRKLVLKMRDLHGNRLFPQKDLAEDYVLGLQSHKIGLKSTFSAYTRLGKDDDQRLIATRELFPNTVKSSIRQKSRWTHGISFQGWERLGWYGSFFQRYFLWRDRKAPLAAVLTVNCFLILAIQPFVKVNSLNYTVEFLLSLNLAFMLFRILLRMHWVKYHHGMLQALLVPLRWTIAIFINTLAGLVAISDFLRARYLGMEVKWKKTQHYFPNHQLKVSNLKTIKRETRSVSGEM